MNDFMNERLTEDGGAAFAPSRYHLKSKNDAIVQPYRTYDLFYEITFCVMQKLGIYEDIGTPEECRQAMERIEEKEKGITIFICSTYNYDKVKWYKPIIKHTARGVSSYANEMYRKYGDAIKVEVQYLDKEMNIKDYCTYSA